MRKLIIASLLTLLSAPASAQVQDTPIVVSGQCDAKSGVTIDDGDNKQSRDGRASVQTRRRCSLSSVSTLLVVPSPF